MEDVPTKTCENELMSETSYLYKQWTDLQQLLQQRQIMVKSTCGMWLLLLLFYLFFSHVAFLKSIWLKLLQN